MNEDKMNEDNAPNPVGWFEIYVDDMERAKAFYEAVFLVKLAALENPMQGPEADEIEMWAFPMHKNGVGASGTLAKMTGFSAGGNAVLVYFSCEDCAVEAKRAEEAGGQIERPKMSIGQYGHIALVRDTEGNLVGLHSLQ